MGDDKILRQNKIPGCDELTRPEEIKALSKFLRHIKDVQSEHTKLQKDNLEIPGRTTGKIPKISKLPNSSQTLDVRKARIDKLEGYSLNVPTNENESGKIKLPNYREKLSDQRKVELSEYVEGLDDNRNPELSKYKENIEDNRTNRLSDHIEGLDDNRKQELSEYRENITDNRKNSLSNYKEELNDSREVELENHRENLNDQRKQELSNYREDIEDKRTNELSDYRENIEDTRINNLSNYRENLQDDRTNQLLNYKETIEDKRDNELENHQEKLSDNRTVELSNHKEKISDSRTNQLETYKEQLEDNRDIQLSEYKQTITDGRNISLSEYRESITDPRENELSNHKENLVDDRKIELSNYKEELRDDRTQELSTYKEIITDPRDTTLSEYKESITDDRNISLSDKKESIVDSRNIELNTYKEEIADDRTTELSDYKEELIVSEENTLSNYIENLEVTQENELSDYQEPLISSSNADSTITELEDGVENIPGTITEQEQLEDFKEQLIDSTNEGSNITELENKRIDITDDRDNSLEDYREELVSSTNSESTITELEDTRIDITYERDNELEDYREQLSSSTNPESTVEELEDERLDLTDDRENSLEDTRIDITDDRATELENTRLDLEDNRENELEDYREELTPSTNEDSTITELEDTRLDLEDDRENTLEDFIEELDDDRENNLEDERINLGGEIKDPELYDESVRLDTPDASNSDTYFDSTQEGNELYDAVLERPNSSNESWFNPEVGGDLYDAVLGLPSHNHKGLLTDIDNSRKPNDEFVQDDEVKQLINEGKASWKKINNEWFLIGEHGEILDPSDLLNTSSYSIDLPSHQVVSKEWKGNVRKPNNEYLSNEEIGKILSDKGAEWVDINGQWFLQDKSGQIVDIQDIFRCLNNKEKLPNSIEADVYSQLLKLLGNMGNWGQKMSSLLTSYYLAIERDDKKLIEEYDSELRRELQLQLTLSKLQVPENNNPKNKNLNTNGSDVNNSTDVDSLYGSETLKKYTDYGSSLSFRDGLLGKVSLPGALRSSALNTAIQVINSVANFFGVKVFDNLVNARLPGLDDDWKDMAKDAVTGAVKSLANTMSSVPVLGNVLGDVATCMERPDPINIPSGVSAAWTPANNRTTTSGNTTGSSSNSSVKEKGSFLDQAKDAVIDMGVDALASALGIGSYSFKVNYLTGKGIGLTLSDLCLSDVSKINTVDDLYDALRKSPFMTVPDKFTTTGNNGYVVTTLDSNSHWEIILEPYCGAENGLTSYLPAIHEINTRNIALHSVNTAYNRWIPFISFDLQKSKLNTKSLSLYDGEINYPVSMEYTNELRLTIADDQYKSWRTYFETCADAAVYNSEPHDISYYQSGAGSLTTIDKSCVLVSSYKNICFRCVIYVMTPQLSTIKKYSLLLVMKDFTEESVGEIDSGGSDLTISFSIVGENPAGEVTATQLNTEKIEKKDSGGGLLSTVLDSGVTSAIGLL